MKRILGVVMSNREDNKSSSKYHTKMSRAQPVKLFRLFKGRPLLQLQLKKKVLIFCVLRRLS